METNYSWMTRHDSFYTSWLARGVKFSFQSHGKSSGCGMTKTRQKELGHFLRGW